MRPLLVFYAIDRLLARQKTIIESNYPVYWVEAFNAAIQEWHPVDPLVTKTVGRPTKFEPPIGDPSNSMSYVIAFDDDGTAKDVTRRYTKAYNAKTRRSRLDSIRGEAQWWKRMMKLFYGGEADRDQVENAQLAHREAAEPMPRNVQDFKDHPFYALERHLRHNEIIEPMKEVGKVSTNKAGSTTEPIYRRRDVKLVKSAQKWYQEGRDIITSEQPLKYAKSRRGRRNMSLSPGASDDEEQNAGTGLYAEHQTVLYVPPPAVRGKIPKNAYGNLDVYVPTMIPRGGVHIRAREAAKAARIVGVDYADAVTGFQFKGRKGTAITTGVVVAMEYADAVVETVRSLRWLQESDLANKRSLMAVRLWKRFLLGLKVLQRVQEYADEDGDVDLDVGREVDEAEHADDLMQGQGGFVPDDEQRMDVDILPEPDDQHSIDESAAMDPFTDPTLTFFDDLNMIVPSPWDLEEAEDPPTTRNVTSSNSKGRDELNREGGGFMIEDDDGGGGGFIADSGQEGGGFVVNDGPEDRKSDQGLDGALDDRRVGFVPEDDDTDTQSQRDNAEQVKVEPPNESGSVAANTTLAQDFEHLNHESMGDDDDGDVQMLPTSADRDTSGDAMMSGALLPAEDGKTADIVTTTEQMADEDENEDEDMEEKDDETSSLLSHDPEDDEGIPDWL